MTRLHIIRACIIAVFVVVALNLFFLQVIRGGYFYRLSLGNSIRVVPFGGERGRIQDRDGNVLASSERAFHVVLIPQSVGKDKSVFTFLGGVLQETPKTLESRYQKGRLTPFTPVSVAEGISREQAIRIEENLFRYPGLMVLEKYRRKYPLGLAAAHVLGYADKPSPERARELAGYGFNAQETVGYSGVEQYFDEPLHGEPGGRQIEVNSRGQQVRLLSLREPSVGADLVLTIDSKIQKAALAALGGRRGAAVVLDPQTGEVLALVSSPSFDPNAFVARERRGEVAEYLQSSASPLLNRAVSSALPPGSIFKIPVATAGLEERKITPDKIFDCPGIFELGGRVFRSPHAWGRQNLSEAMGHSANEYFFHTGLLVGPEQMARYARVFGLGERTGITLPYESRGNIPFGPQPMRWYKGDTVNMSIGQGTVLATPLQIARMMAVFANGGYLVQPRLVKTIGGKDACPDTSKGIGLFSTEGCRLPLRIVLRKETWEALRRVLYSPVMMETGTAHTLEMQGLDTMGKTGTAQAGAGKDDHAWFAGVTRSSKANLAYCLLFENGGSSANAVAAVREMLVSLQDSGRI